MRKVKREEVLQQVNRDKEMEAKRLYKDTYFFFIITFSAQISFDRSGLSYLYSYYPDHFFFYCNMMSRAEAEE